MNNTLIYCAKPQDLSITKDTLELILNLQFILRIDEEDQDYYFYGDIDGDNLEIMSNFNASDEHFVLPPNKEYGTIFTINTSLPAQAFIDLLTEKAPELVLFQIYGKE